MRSLPLLTRIHVAQQRTHFEVRLVAEEGEHAERDALWADGVRAQWILHQTCRLRCEKSASCSAHQLSCLRHILVRQRAQREPVTLQRQATAMWTRSSPNLESLALNYSSIKPVLKVFPDGLHTFTRAQGLELKQQYLFEEGSTL